MILAAGLVSTSFIVGAAIAPGLDPAVLMLVRFLLAALLFAPYVLARHGLASPGRAGLARYAAISAPLVVFFWCMFTALRSTSALNTSALFTLVPSFSGIYSALLVRERLGGQRLIALGLGMIGALWIIFRGSPERLLALELNRGDLLFLAGCLAMGLYTPLIKLLHREEPMAVMTFWILVTGSGWLLLLSGSKLVGVEWRMVEGEVWLGIFYLALFTTVVTFFLTQFATLRLGPTRVMAYSYLYPGLVLLFNWALGHGWPPVMTLPGVVIVLGAMVVLQRGAET